MKWAIFAATWRILRPRLKSTITLAVALVLVTITHSEYVEYVQLTQDKNWLVESYLLKWVIVIASICLYVAYNAGILFRCEIVSSVDSRQHIQPGDQEKGDDGFDFLRDKPRLNSEADRILNRE